MFEALDAALSLAVAVGLWHMRCWSVALYGALVALNLAVAILLWPVVADARRARGHRQTRKMR